MPPYFDMNLAIASVAERSPHLIEFFPLLAAVDRSVGGPSVYNYTIPTKLVETTGGGPVTIASSPLVPRYLFELR